MSMKILVQPAAGETVKAKFTDCIVQLLGYDLWGEVITLYKDNALVLTVPSPNDSLAKKTSVTIKHSPLCPFRELSKQTTEEEALLEDKSVLLAVSVLVQSSDGYILLTRRPLHMRTFPGIWVTPGGHVDEGESLETAVARELKEETGLSLNLSKDKLSIVALWESAYPHHLSFGYPTRHHIITYFLCSLAKSHSELQKELKLEANEVSLCAWLSKNQINYIVNNKLDELAQKSPRCSVIEISGDASQIITEKDVTDIFQFGSGYQGRISAGTMYALEQLMIQNDGKLSELSHL